MNWTKNEYHTCVLLSKKVLTSCFNIPFNNLVGALFEIEPFIEAIKESSE